MIIYIYIYVNRYAILALVETCETLHDTCKTLHDACKDCIALLLEPI